MWLHGLGHCVLSEHRQWPFSVFHQHEETNGGLATSLNKTPFFRVLFPFAPDSRAENSCGAERRRNCGSEEGRFHPSDPRDSWLSSSAFFSPSYLANEAIKSSLFFWALGCIGCKAGTLFPTTEKTRQKKGARRCMQDPLPLPAIQPRPGAPCFHVLVHCLLLFPLL